MLSKVAIMHLTLHDPLKEVEASHINTSAEECCLTFPSHPRIESGCRTVSVIGGGFCGTVAVIQLLRLLTSPQSEDTFPEHLAIDWCDTSGWFGRGLPYRQQHREEDNEKLILNQPAALMSPFPDDPDAYTRWLSREHPQFINTSFTPRSVFGAFLEWCLNEAQERAGRSVTITRHREEVCSVDPDTPSILLAGSGTRIVSDAVIIATGHQVTDRFQHLAGTPGYLSTPFDVESFRSLDLEELRDIILIGGGPSAIDAARVLDGLGYRGSYHVIARRLSPPWPFHPELYLSSNTAPFVAQHLVPERIPDDVTYRQLRKLLRKEVLLARAHGFGDGHVYYGIDIRALERRLETIADRTAAAEFGSLVAFLRGNITAPENVALLRTLAHERRLAYLKGHALPSSTHFCSQRHRYHTVVAHPSGARLHVEGDAVVNCALFARSSSPTALGHMAPDAATKRTIFAVGPALTNSLVIPRTWGVESFREEICNAARSALRAF